MQGQFKQRRTVLRAAIGAGVSSLGFGPVSNAFGNSSEKRVALCIGNASYPSMSLRNTTNDAQAVANVLKTAGYQTVVKENLNSRDMVSSLRDYSESSADTQVRLLYFAGHGIQIRGRNYLLPVEPLGNTTESLLAKAIALDDIFDRLNTKRNGVDIVVIDACRTNPFNHPDLLSQNERQLQLRNVGKSGLAATSPPYGAIIAFSTSPGKVALDNPSQTLGVYAKHFVREFNKKNLAFEAFFKSVRTAVVEETARGQVPWESSSLTGNVCIRAGLC